MAACRQAARRLQAVPSQQEGQQDAVRVAPAGTVLVARLAGLETEAAGQAAVLAARERQGTVAAVQVADPAGSRMEAAVGSPTLGRRRCVSQSKKGACVQLTPAGACVQS